MSSLSLRLPESLHQKVRELAERDDISINQFIATAVAWSSRERRRSLCRGQFRPARQDAAATAPRATSQP